MNFTVVGDVGPDEVRPVVARLEGLIAAASQFLRTAGYRPLPPATLILLDGRGDLRRAGIEDKDPYVFVGEDRDFLVLTDAGDREAVDAVLRAYFLAIADRSVPNAPFWVREGLAAFYGTTEWSGGRLEAGRPIEDYVRAVRNRRDRLGIARLSEISSEADLTPADHVFPAEAWALVHYLITRGESGGHDQTAELVRRMATGESFEAAADAAFQTGFRQILAEFDAVMEGRGTLPRITLAVDPAIGAITPAGPVSEVDAMTLVGAMMAAGGLPGAEAQLGRAIAADRNASGPYVALAQFLFARGRYDEVRYAIDQAGRREDPGALAHYYYALSIVEENPDPSPGQLSRIRSELQLAIDLDPALADAYHRLAASYLGAGENDGEALRLLETAMNLRPETPDYLVTYSRFLVEQGRFDDARDVLLPLIGAMKDSATRDRATEIMESIAGRTGGRGLVGEGFAEIRTGSRTGTQSSEADTPPAPAATASDRVQLTRVVEGERQSGLLTLVDCRDGLDLTVEDDNGAHVFHTDSPERVTFSSASAANLGREIRCGYQEPPVRVRVTFRPPVAGSDYAGVPTAVEFVED